MLYFCNICKTINNQFGHNDRMKIIVYIGINEN